MDELLIAVVLHGIDEAISELAKASASPNPIASVLTQNTSPLAVAMGTELAIHARNRPALRAAISDATGRHRTAQTALLERHFRERGAGTIPPEVATVVPTSVLRALSLEDGVGVSSGHRETYAWLVAHLGLPDLPQKIKRARHASSSLIKIKVYREPRTKIVPGRGHG